MSWQGIHGDACHSPCVWHPGAVDTVATRHLKSVPQTIVAAYLTDCHLKELAGVLIASSFDTEPATLAHEVAKSVLPLPRHCCVKFTPESESCVAGAEVRCDKTSSGEKSEGQLG